jgi:hypothetical protein
MPVIEDAVAIHARLLIAWLERRMMTRLVALENAASA